MCVWEGGGLVHVEVGGCVFGSVESVQKGGGECVWERGEVAVCLEVGGEGVVCLEG